LSENNQNNKKKRKKNKKCKIKCSTCEFYDEPLDYCSQKEIEECTTQVHINFSSCDEYLVREELIMF
jgi:hypothetical protein